MNKTRESRASLSSSSGTHFILDEIDRRILKYLQKDGKASFRKISRKLGISVSTVKSHLDKLTEEGILLGFVPLINCHKIGYNEMVLLSLSVNRKEKISRILEILSSLEELNCVYHVSGERPIFCMAKCIEKEHVIDLVEKIKSYEWVEDILVEIVLQNVKEDFCVKIP